MIRRFPLSEILGQITWMMSLHIFAALELSPEEAVLQISKTVSRKYIYTSETLVKYDNFCTSISSSLTFKCLVNV